MNEGDGIRRMDLFRLFNEKFFNKSFYSLTYSPFEAIHEDNRRATVSGVPTGGEKTIFERVMDLYQYTDFYKLMGIPMTELMAKCDLPHLVMFEDRLSKDKQEKINAMKKTDLNFKRKADSLRNSLK